MTDMSPLRSEIAVVTSGLPQRLTMSRIREIVADHFEITVAELISKNRKKIVVRPRQISMYFCKELTPRTYPEIGRFFGNRDHSTVIHAYRLVGQLSETDLDLKEELAQLWDKMGAARAPAPTVEVEITAGGEKITLATEPSPPPPRALLVPERPLSPLPQFSTREQPITLDMIRNEVAEYYEVSLADLALKPLTEDMRFYREMVDRLIRQAGFLHNLPIHKREEVDWDGQIDIRHNRMVREDMKVLWHRLMLQL